VPDTWITDMTCYLDGAGRVVPMPGVARRIANHFGSIVAAMSPRPPEQIVLTLVTCRRRPGRRPCTGRIQAVVNAEARIRWQCPSCGDNGLISGWQNSPWDTRRLGSLH